MEALQPVLNEALGVIYAAIGTALLGLAELGRRSLESWMQRQGIIGAVQRAAGLALEYERTGSPPAQAVEVGVSYVHKAVPKALAKQGVSPHLVDMVQGAMGVLRASQGALNVMTAAQDTLSALRPAQRD